MGKERKTPRTFKCTNCGSENNWRYSSHNKFCNNRCQREHEWTTVTQHRAAEGTLVDNNTIRKFLVKTRGAVCNECGCRDTWNGKPLTLHVDHIDGNSDNNVLTNLRLLCPNCHSQTSTWCGRNTKTKKQTRRNTYTRNYYSKKSSQRDVLDAVY